VNNAAHTPPSKPGYSTQMHPDSIAKYRYPDDTYWAARLNTRAAKTDVVATTSAG